MKVSLNWAKYVAKHYNDIDLIDVSNEELINLATERLGGIEGVTDVAKKYERVVVARVVSCVKHPDADKLHVCMIDDGGVTEGVERDEVGLVQVVCGAPNIKEGLLVAWIPPKAVVPSTAQGSEPFILGSRELRGVMSNGMIASAKELDLNDEHEGILIISDDQLANDNALANSNHHLKEKNRKSQIDNTSQIDPQEVVIPAPDRVEGKSPAGIQDSELDSRLHGNDETVQPGTPFVELFGLDDLILDIENKMFTHRPDCFGQLGVARELAGIQGKAFKSPDWYLSPNSNDQLAKDKDLANSESQMANASPIATSILSITNQVPELCPRYMAVVIEGVEIKPSPLWLQSHLKRVGVKPINNVVDITNYMMMLTAQPLHAFDYDKVAKDGKAKIVVRKPKNGERMTLLDGKVIQPHEDATLICDGDGPIALGGVMGGGNSEIDENTKRIVLECATFNMYNIRKTSMIHGIFTDAVTRFNKGQPAAQLPSVLGKAIDMLKELAGTESVIAFADSNPDVEKSKPVKVSTEFINARLGSSFKTDEIKTILENVEMSVEIQPFVIPDYDQESSNKEILNRVQNDTIVVTAPFWRTDIEIPEDIVEEVGRMYGFNRLPLELPKRSIKPVAPEPALQLKQQIREILSRAGANEVLTYSFVHGNLLEKVGQDPKNSYAIRNALSPDLQYYRQTLTPSLLDHVHSNVKAGFDEFVLFELNKTHNKVHGNNEEGLPGELNMAALTFASNKKDADAAYFNARRYLDYLADQLGFTLSYSPIEKDPGYPVTAPFEFSRSALVTIKEVDVFLGIVGEYRQEVRNGLKLPKASAGFEIGLDHILEALEKLPASSYKPLSKYPSTSQDITLKTTEDVSFEQLQASVESQLAESDYQYKIETISIFQPSSVIPGSEGESRKKLDSRIKSENDKSRFKNTTFRITLSRYDRTLTTAQANKLVEEIVKRAKTELKAEQV
jgi:phenylalanyl-tRNA synthetase beta chain